MAESSTRSVLAQVSHVAHVVLGTDVLADPLPDEVRVPSDEMQCQNDVITHSMAIRKLSKGIGRD